MRLKCPLLSIFLKSDLNTYGYVSQRPVLLGSVGHTFRGQMWHPIVRASMEILCTGRRYSVTRESGLVIDGETLKLEWKVVTYIYGDGKET